ncbi:hypothetical protein [Sphingobium limneticum]|uniref:Uncharacterized protein n=1 Tax=Sphingobium limneticum TaxID=1007511 RepID=A0A5J5IA02_9SPHN|nr:hypothetical protein [Sphingobium limneticum]KAA9019613.1 hypothetical protein F4U96_05010 [Sphingobium limneticum]KAA9032071.1 hypothetical protein F4U95_05010 [Sphingobium limneticum]
MQSIPLALDGFKPIICVSMSDLPIEADGQPSHLPPTGSAGANRLYTATLHLLFEGYSITMFHACRASSRVEARERVSSRVASHLMADVEIHHGIDLGHPVVRRLVPSEIAHRLFVHGDCSLQWRPLQHGGELHIQERAGA